ncbi:hypothetical protein DH2020_007572 [Rehmannia glutinosa]|uniref:Reverse transcriptase zinc-binding domain-containing protein n=1 Tax=Rehmannia glutinosa TaxID=99300 RepID=A0ABR0TYK2_REHGL
MAMLAKQGWRLIRNESSLISKVLQAKYFPHNTFLESIISHNPSYIWRSVVESKKVLGSGLVWNIGDGSKVNAWFDPWIPENPSFKPKTQMQVAFSNLHVNNLIMNNTRRWNEELIYDIFEPADAKAIISIMLTTNRMEDKLVWNYAKDGRYKVKSGYKLATMDMENCDSVSSTSGSNFWKWLWHLNVPEKILIFAWKCAHGIIPTKRELQKKGSTLESWCPRCGEAEETLEHALRDCGWVTHFWVTSPLRLCTNLRDNEGSMFDWMQRIRAQGDEEGHTLFLTLLWALWDARNKLVFQGKMVDQTWVHQMAVSRLNEHEIVANSRENFSTSNAAAEKWKPSEEGCLKLNTDASLRDDLGMGLGAVIRNYRGEIMKSVSKLIPLVDSVEIAEALACREGVEMARHMNVSLTKESNLLYHDEAKSESGSLEIIQGKKKRKKQTTSGRLCRRKGALKTSFLFALCLELGQVPMIIPLHFEIDTFESSAEASWMSLSSSRLRMSSQMLGAPTQSLICRLLVKYLMVKVFLSIFAWWHLFLTFDLVEKVGGRMSLVCELI